MMGLVKQICTTPRLDVGDDIFQALRRLEDTILCDDEAYCACIYSVEQRRWKRFSRPRGRAKTVLLAIWWCFYHFPPASSVREEASIIDGASYMIIDYQQDARFEAEQMLASSAPQWRDSITANSELVIGNQHHRMVASGLVGSCEDRASLKKKSNSSLFLEHQAVVAQYFLFLATSGTQRTAQQFTRMTAFKTDRLWLLSASVLVLRISINYWC